MMKIINGFHFPSIGELTNIVAEILLSITESGDFSNIKTLDDLRLECNNSSLYYTIDFTCVDEKFPLMSKFYSLIAEEYIKYILNTNIGRHDRFELFMSDTLWPFCSSYPCVELICLEKLIEYRRGMFLKDVFLTAYEDLIDRCFSECALKGNRQISEIGHAGFISNEFGICESIENMFIRNIRMVRYIDWDADNLVVQDLDKDLEFLRNYKNSGNTEEVVVEMQYMQLVRKCITIDGDRLEWVTGG